VNDISFSTEAMQLLRVQSLLLIAVGGVAALSNIPCFYIMQHVLSIPACQRPTVFCQIIQHAVLSVSPILDLIVERFEISMHTRKQDILKI
jgi:hypothetical protein